MEWKLFTGDVPHVSTFEFHQDRERAPHLEQAFKQELLHLAAEFVRQAVREIGGGESFSVSDLGCGDGGLLSLVKDEPGVEAWGYDFCPANAAGWAERGVRAWSQDVFGDDWYQTGVGDVAVMTEVLEHLADPHGVLSRVRGRGAQRLVCSSPWNERPAMHSPEHAWAWNLEGYAKLIQDAGWTIERHEQAGLFQVVLAR